MKNTPEFSSGFSLETDPRAEKLIKIAGKKSVLENWRQAQRGERVYFLGQDPNYFARTTCIDVSTPEKLSHLNEQYKKLGRPPVDDDPKAKFYVLSKKQKI